jgi:tetratricopeptide (TPR) repeat protein
VKEALALMLATHRNLDSKKRAIQFALEAVRVHPKSPQAWQTLGLASHSLGAVSEKRRGDDIDYAAKAIKAYQKCLQLAPPDYGPRERLENAIVTIRAHPHLWITQTKYQ